jgi:hypothetical protein
LGLIAGSRESSSQADHFSKRFPNSRWMMSAVFTCMMLPRQRL